MDGRRAQISSVWQKLHYEIHPWFCHQRHFVKNVSMVAAMTIFFNNFATFSQIFQ
jgi:hypothetical protein